MIHYRTTHWNSCSLYTEAIACAFIWHKLSTHRGVIDKNVNAKAKSSNIPSINIPLDTIDISSGWGGFIIANATILQISYFFLHSEKHSSLN